MPELVRSAKLAVEKGQSQGRNGTYIKQLTDYIIPALVEALHKVIFLVWVVIFSLDVNHDYYLFWKWLVCLYIIFLNLLAGA